MCVSSRQVLCADCPDKMIEDNAEMFLFDGQIWIWLSNFKTFVSKDIYNGAF